MTLGSLGRRTRPTQKFGRHPLSGVVMGGVESPESTVEPGLLCPSLNATTPGGLRWLPMTSRPLPNFLLLSNVAGQAGLARWSELPSVLGAIALFIQSSKPETNSPHSGSYSGFQSLPGGLAQHGT